jgi:hypothetical protein
MKASVADAAGRDASPSGAAPDTDAPISFETVTQGRCHRVRPIISCPFATATMSDAARRPASRSGLITDFLGVANCCRLACDGGNCDRSLSLGVVRVDTQSW